MTPINNFPSHVEDHINFRNPERDLRLLEAKSKNYLPKKPLKHNHEQTKALKNLAKLKIHAEKCEACRVEYKMMQSELQAPLPSNIHSSYNFNLIQSQIIEIKKLIAGKSKESWV